ncbi:carboxyl-terminal processing protease [Nonlabens dokdonensis]|jgi:carboxyl-terminal processing protease|uniref:Carboxyl-terminal protease, Peptidase S41 family n=2 Tax=Nonlabens dokdonensis TaxID=328515 RepID=L7WA81_NONDD|nr:S41 family peptidase [Nonlabens dokdonensis]AGC77044.1 carboxyl-terminal protease, Peptidase S41 family [Nonlabens dokdonensis DSW-6]PZX41006.1 carboxyl-terminal processing protease [Nonlabens dokdonensis]
MKKSYLYYPLFLGIIFAIGIWLGSVLNENSIGNDYIASSSSLKKRKLNRLIDLIDQRYVDQINTDSIVDVTVNEIMQNLDPHSVYIPSSELEDVDNNMRGDFVGIGIRFFVNQDSISVLRAIEDGPSDKAGIKGGDKILYADGKPLFGANAISTNVLKGEEGSKIVLGILRPGDEEVINVPVVRGNVAIKSIDASYMLTNKLGYIKINRFAESTEEEFKNAIKQLKRAGATQIALDLRDNPGGVLSAAVAIADEFLKEDQLILFQKDRNDKRKDSYATDRGSYENSAVYILINENSASASEVVAGALQDNDKGTIIGRRSFGKGLVQQEIKLGDGSAVRLTIARYYTPTGRSIQRPYSNGNEDYFKEYIDRYSNGELQNEENIQVNDSLKRVTPGGKVVYGGGGIIPDVFVASPDGYVLQTLNYFGRTGFADQFVNRYLQDEGKFMRDMSQEEFINSYEVTEEMMKEFILYAQLNNTSIKLPGYRDEIALIIKSSLAEQLFTTELKVKLLNQEDEMIEKLLELSTSRSS